MGNTSLLLFVESNTNTWLGVAIVSETMTFFPSGETASTLPVTDLNSLSVGVLALALNTISPLVPNSPKSVPRKAFFPCASKTSELGVAGKFIAFPTVLAGAVIGLRAVCRYMRARMRK